MENDHTGAGPFIESMNRLSIDLIDRKHLIELLTRVYGISELDNSSEGFKSGLKTAIDFIGLVKREKL